MRATTKPNLMKMEETYRVDFDGSENWVETENPIKYKNLPDVVKDAIKRDYDKDNIVEVERVESAKC